MSLLRLTCYKVVIYYNLPEVHLSMTRCPRTLLVSHCLHSTENQRLKRSYWKYSNEHTFNGLNSKQDVTKVVSKLGHYWHYSL